MSNSNNVTLPTVEDLLLITTEYLCDSCKSAPEVIFCADCKMDLCLSCSQSKHEEEQDQNHVRMPMCERTEFQNKPDQKAARKNTMEQLEIAREKFLCSNENLCEECGVHTKSVYCHACGKEYCITCSISVHTTGSKVNHNRVACFKKNSIIAQVENDPSAAYAEVSADFRHPYACERYKWVPDSKRSKCVACSVAFTTTNRRHHCRMCGDIFCNSCSNKKVTLRFEPDAFNDSYIRKVRVCGKCEQAYLKLQMEVLGASNTSN